MKIKPILKVAQTAANLIIVAGAAKAIYNKFSSSDDEDDGTKPTRTMTIKDKHISLTVLTVETVTYLLKMARSSLEQ